MNPWLSYLFWPNPGNAGYDSPKAMALIIACVLLVILSFIFSWWRRSNASAAVRKISKSWSTAMLWFGLIGLVLIIARVEQIQFLAMRFMWLLWGISLVLYLMVQMRVYRLRYYEVLPTKKVVDPRSKYLPKRKK